jgi:predicted DsbA family dithiol-disulfide isomerase
MNVAPGTIVVWSDIGCAWAHRAVYRLHETRHRLGLEGRVTFEHRPYPLELINDRATPRNILAAEVPVIGAYEPDAGWRLWDRPEWQWPVTTLLALEAVQAAAEEGPAVAERLDRALRLAFFGEGRCISLMHVILEVADGSDGVDGDALARALSDGRARSQVIDGYQAAATGDEVKGSPHLFLPDGTDAHNPGFTVRWQGEPGTGYPVIEADDPAVYDELVTRAAG